MTGPSSIQGAHVIRLKKANCTVVARSQARDRKSAQPSAMSARRLGRRAGSVPPAAEGLAWPPAAAGRRSRLSASTLTAYEAASAATTTAGPARATRIPPSAGPAMLAEELASPYRVFALPS